ncbi:hypothetical protein [Nocardia sp. NPDC058705]|uniref:hypothetical protein n=1 Tax=Nocardia sp. NPDC058705 TaxID=3346609 RepID=UPI003688CBB6
MRHHVDVDLPSHALRAARAGVDSTDIGGRYLEPITALQDDDLAFPDSVELAYYAIYNCFRKYVRGDDLDDRPSPASRHFSAWSERGVTDANSHPVQNEHAQRGPPEQAPSPADADVRDRPPSANTGWIAQAVSEKDRFRPWDIR